MGEGTDSETCNKHVVRLRAALYPTARLNSGVSRPIACIRWSIFLNRTTCKVPLVVCCAATLEDAVS